MKKDVNKKMIDLINVFNEKIDDPITNDSEIRLKIRGFVNRILETFHDKKIDSCKLILSETKSKTNLSKIVDLINTATHDEYDNNYSIYTVIRNFELFWNEIENLFNFEIKPNFPSWKMKDENYEWKFEKEFLFNQNEKYIILSRKQFESFYGNHYYEISNHNNPNPISKLNKITLYVDDEIEMAIGENYKFKINIERLWISDESQKITRFKLATDPIYEPETFYPSLPTELINIKNSIVSKTNRNSYYDLLAIEQNWDEIIYDEIISWRKKFTDFLKTVFTSEVEKNKIKYPKNHLIKNKKLAATKCLKYIYFLRHPNKSLVSKVEWNNIESYSPLLNEFWTKNQKEFKTITFFEKEILKKFIENQSYLKPLFSDAFFFKENEKFHLKMKSKNTLYEKVENDFKIEDKFKDNHIFEKEYRKKFALKKICKFEVGENWAITTNENKILIDKIQEMMKNNSESNFPIDYQNLSFEFWDSVELSESRIETIIKILKRRISIITGSAGVGKTLVASTITKILWDNLDDVKIIFAAPTIKASKLPEDFYEKLKEDETKPVIETMTLHALTDEALEFESDDKVVLIVDEISMIDLEIWEKLIDIHDIFSQIIFIGDEMQLPPIKSPPLSQYLFENDFDDLYKLEKNHRQQDSKIISNILNPIRNGEKIKNTNNIFSFEYAFEYLDYLENKVDIDNTKIISPINNGLFGIKKIQEIVSGKNESDSFEIGEELCVETTTSRYPGKKFTYAGKFFRVTYMENGQDAVLYKTDIVCDLKNGQFYNDSNDFFYNENKFIWFKVDHKGEIECNVSRVNAISTHKAQGSTYENIVFVIPPGYNIDSKMLYTALSRAKNDVKIIVHKLDEHKLI